MLSLTIQLHQPATSPTTIDRPSIFAYYSSRNRPYRPDPLLRASSAQTKHTKKVNSLITKVQLVSSAQFYTSLSAAPRCTILHNSTQFHALGTRGSPPAAGHPPQVRLPVETTLPTTLPAPLAPQTMRHSGSGRDSAEESCAQLDFRINLILSCG